MTSPAETRPRRARRVGFRGSTNAEQAAASEILSQLALAAESGSSLLETLNLPSAGRIRGVTELPAFWVATVTICLAVGVVCLFFPTPLPLLALVPLVLIVSTLRVAVADTARIHPVALTEVEISRALASAMGDGLTLSQAMAHLPRVFTPAQVAVARAGEEANSLAPALRLLAKQAEARQGGTILTFRRIYPIAVLIISMAPVAFILWKVIPKYVDIFDQLGAELPSLTLFIIQFSESGRHIPLSMAVVLALCFLVMSAIQPALGRLAAGSVCAYLLLVLPWPDLEIRSSRRSGVVFDFTPLLIVILPALGFALPFIGESLSALGQRLGRVAAALLPSLRLRAFGFDRAAFLESLGLLLERRVPAPDALRSAASALHGAGLERLARRAALRVEQGVALVAALEAMHLLRRRQAVLLRLAADAGTLPSECQRLSETLTVEAAHRIACRERILRPVGIMIVGGLAALFIAGLYLPLFNIPGIVGGE